MSPEEIRTRVSEQVRLQTEQAVNDLKRKSRKIMIFTVVFVIIMLLVLFVVKRWI